MSRTPVVCLPGLMQDARAFAPQIDALSATCAVMVAPTHLDDTVEEIAASVLNAAPPEFTLLGTSLGGAVALEVARAAPERVKGLCLISTAAMSETPDMVANRDLQMASVRGGRFDDVMTEALSLTGLADNPFRLEIAGIARDMAATLGAEVFVRQSTAMQRRRDQQSILRKITMPTLILCGEGDQQYSVKRHQFMAEMIPRARFEVVDLASHLVMLEQPGTVNEILRDWLP